MAEIINLRRARKGKARVTTDKAAQANRAAHGTPKAVRTLAEARQNKAEQHLAGHKLENEPDDN
jgi:hypothetical protein